MNDFTPNATLAGAFERAENRKQGYWLIVEREDGTISGLLFAAQPDRWDKDKTMGEALRIAYEAFGPVRAWNVGTHRVGRNWRKKDAVPEFALPTFLEARIRRFESGERAEGDGAMPPGAPIFLGFLDVRTGAITPDERGGPLPETPAEALPRAEEPPSPAEPEPDAIHVRNEAGEVERVWWERTLPGGPRWSEKVAARVLRRTETKARILFLARDVAGGKPKDDPAAWKPSETWVQAKSLSPRERDEKTTISALFPDF